ncbi:trafficking protein particle complex subunit 13 isoform X2 [Daktulosphaira vitifoliae]|uniref:trafficking protein particle complex subunit 13 isoform X2 n=1 Tax=Daktulosphaira vitifoliae TaxID=58002 RepID=UPI0021AB06EC|nr:trafficking protein particle complex subunit 13 isoform X2 [Daktulosphaira vitifoliae]
MTSIEVKEVIEHPIKLRVMRLGKPVMCNSKVIACDPEDLPGTILNEQLKNDVTSLSNSETLAAGSFLMVPNVLENLYLGETFLCYVYLKNESAQTIYDIVLKAEIDTATSHIPILGPKTFSKLDPYASIDVIVKHEVKEHGSVNKLICQVEYDRKHSFETIFSYRVPKPLDLKTKFYNTVTDEVYLEVQVQNIMSTPITLEKFNLEPSVGYNVHSMNQLLETPYNKSVFGDLDLLDVKETRQYMYRLCYDQNSEKQPSRTNNLGKLDILWRSNMGTKGQIQSSPLVRQIPELDDITFSLTQLPEMVLCEEQFNFSCSIKNNRNRDMQLIVEVNDEENNNLAWTMISGMCLGLVPPYASTKAVFSMVALNHGLQGLKLKSCY